MNQYKGMSLQEYFAPHSICFGCGPANKTGLQIRSFVLEKATDAALIATWHAKPEHQAFPGIVNGGIIGALLDCHSNWTACWHLMNINKLETPPCTVTAWFNVTLKRPTPSDALLELIARPVEVSEHKVRVQATLSANQKLSATCEGLFIAVAEGHPAYNRWA